MPGETTTTTTATPKPGEDAGKKDTTAKPGEEKKTTTSPADAGKKDEGKKDEKVETKSEDKGGELAGVFDDDKKDKSKEEKPSEAPASDLKLTVPNDLKDLFGKPDDFVTAAKGAGLTQKQLDAVMAVHFDRVKAAVQSAEQGREKARLETRRELLADPKLGGANLQKTMQVAERGARALGGSALAVKLAKHLRGEETIDGLTLVRAFHMAGLESSEDRLGGSGDARKKDDDANLTPEEREFKRTNPKTWERMQEEKKARGG
jgi:hypothetical protein